MKTVEDFRKALGLQDLETFHTAAKLRNQVAVGSGKLRPKDMERGLGQTTIIILQALVKIQDGNPVWFVGSHPYQPRKTALRARAYARRLGIRSELVHWGPSDSTFLINKKGRYFHS